MVARTFVGRLARARVRLRRARPFILIAIAYLYFFQGTEPNQSTRFLLTRALVSRGSADIGPDHPHTIDKSLHGGVVRSDKSPFVALAAAPAFLLARAVSGPLPRRLDDVESAAPLRARLHFIVFCVSGLAGIASAILFSKIARSLGFSRTLTELLTLGYALGTNVFAFATTLFGHVLSGALLLGAFWLAVRARRRGADLTAREAAGLGALLATAGLTEYPVAIPGAALGLYVLSWSLSWPRVFRLAAGVALGALAPVAIHATYTYAAFGSPFALPYRDVFAPVFAAHMSQGFFGLGAPKLRALSGVLFSPYRGIFYLSPFLALSLYGFTRWLSPGEPRRREGLCALAMVLVSLWTTSAYYAWDGDLSTGPRHMVATMAFIALGAGFAVRDLGRRGLALAGALIAPSCVILWAIVAVSVQLPKGDPRVSDPLHEIVVPALRRGDVPLPREDLSLVVGVRVDGAHNIGRLLGVAPRAAAALPFAALALLYLGPLLGAARRRRRSLERLGVTS